MFVSKTATTHSWVKQTPFKTVAQKYSHNDISMVLFTDKNSEHTIKTPQIDWLYAHPINQQECNNHQGPYAWHGHELVSN